MMFSDLHGLQAIAAEYASHGLAVIPGLPMSKEPAVPWRAFQREAPTRPEREAMFSVEYKLNLGVICGAVSQNLVVLDAETEKAFAETIHRCESAGFGDTWIVKTRRGGHVYFFLSQPVKPMKDADVEVRAQGQFVLMPPSTHPTGARYEFTRRPASIAQVPTLDALDWLKLEPAALRNHHKQLPRNAWRLLQGEIPDRYASRSEAEQAIITGLVNAGFSFDEISRVFQSYPAAGKYSEIRRRDSGLAVRWLRSCFENARTFCLQESPSRGLAREALSQATARAWPGRTGSTDRAVYLAHASLAYRSGRVTYHASARNLAELAGCERRTASIATRRLSSAGLLQLTRRSSFQSANRYQLGRPTGKVSDLVPLTTTTCGGVGQTSSFRLPDAFRPRGLGRSAYEVLSVLQNEPLTAKVIAEKTGRHIQTVRKALAKMRDLRLVEKQGRFWLGCGAINDLDLEALAKDVGSYGAGERQREKHLAERLRRTISNSILQKKAEQSQEFRVIAGVLVQSMTDCPPT